MPIQDQFQKRSKSSEFSSELLEPPERHGDIPELQRATSFTPNNITYLTNPDLQHNHQSDLERNCQENVEIISLSKLREDRRNVLREQRKEDLKLLYRTYSAWVTFVQFRKLKEKHAIVADTYLCRKVLQKNYKIWKSSYRESARNITSVHEVQLYKFELSRRRKSLQSVFSKWSCYVKLRREKNELKYKAEKLKRRIKLTTYLFVWRRKKDEKIIGQDVKACRFHSAWKERKRKALLNKTLHCWKAYTYLVRKKVHLNAIEKSYQVRIINKFFTIWLQNYGKSVNRQISLAQHFYQTIHEPCEDLRVIRTCFTSWLCYIAYRKRKKTNKNVAISYHHRKCTNRYFSMWRNCTVSARQEKFALAVSFYNSYCSAKQFKLKKRCFHAIVENKIESIKRREREQLADNFCIRRLLLANYCKWKLTWSNKKCDNDKTCLALWHWSNCLKRKVFSSWQNTTSHLKAERIEDSEAFLIRRALIQRHCIYNWILRADSVLICTSEADYPSKQSSNIKHPHCVYNCAQIWLRKWRRSKRFGLVSKPLNNRRESHASVLEILEKPKFFNQRYSYNSNQLPIPQRHLHYLREIAETKKYYNLVDVQLTIPNGAIKLNNHESHFSLRSVSDGTRQEYSIIESEKPASRVDNLKSARERYRLRMQNMALSQSNQHLDFNNSAFTREGKNVGLFIPHSKTLDSFLNTTGVENFDDFVSNKDKDTKYQNADGSLTREMSNALLGDITVNTSKQSDKVVKKPKPLHSARCPDFMRMSIQRMGIDLDAIDAPSANASVLVSNNSLQNSKSYGDLHNVTQDVLTNNFQVISQSNDVVFPMLKPLVSETQEKVEFEEMGQVNQRECVTPLEQEASSLQQQASLEHINLKQHVLTQLPDDVDLRATISIDKNLLMRPNEFTAKLRSSTPFESSNVKDDSTKCIDNDSFTIKHIEIFSNNLASEIVAETSRELSNNSSENSANNTNVEHEMPKFVETSTQTDVGEGENVCGSNKEEIETQTEFAEQSICKNCSSVIEPESNDVAATSHGSRNGLLNVTNNTMNETSNTFSCNSVTLNNSKYTIEVRRKVVQYKNLKARSEKKQTALKTLIAEITQGSKSLTEYETSQIVKLKQEIRSLNKQLTELKQSIKSLNTQH